LLERSDAYVVQHGHKYNIDESHNHIHSRHVLYYAKEIMQRRPHRLSPYDVLLASLGSLLHDVPDSKYIQDPWRDGVMDEALDHVLSESFHVTRVRHDLLTMIPHLSFSKTVRLDPVTDKLVFTVPPAVHNHPHLLESYHLVRQADLLASYNTKRTLLYRMHKSGHSKTQDEVLNEALGLYKNRMAKLRDSGLFVFPEADKELARPLEGHSQRQWDTMPSSFFTWEEMLHHFSMDPQEPWEKTLDDVDRLYREAS
jgi:hypothetical protein